MKKYLILVIVGMVATMLGSAMKIPRQPVWYGQYLSLLFVMFISIPFALWSFNKWLAIFIGYCAFSTFFVTSLNPRAIVLLWQLSLGALASYGISRFKPKYRMAILVTIVGLVIIQSFWMGLQFFGKDPIFHSIKNIRFDNMVGFSGSPDQMGTFFAMTFPVVLYVFPPLYVLSALGLYFSRSSFALVSAVASMVLYFFLTNKKIFRILVVVSIVAFFIFVFEIDKISLADFGTRFAAWNYAVKSTIAGRALIQYPNGRQFLLSCNPIFGYGLGNFNSIFPYIPQQVGIYLGKVGYNFNYIDEKFTHAHNDYIEIFFEMGYAGLVIMFGLIGGFFYNFYKSKKSKELVLYFSCILAYLLNSMGNFLSNIAVSGMLLVVFYGLYEATRKELNG